MSEMFKNIEYGLYQRKGSNIYYVQFKNSDGTWSVAKSTGETHEGRARTWVNSYIDKGNIVSKENIIFENFSKGFFNYNGSWATDKRVRGLRISPRHCLERTDILNNHLIPAIGKMKLTAIDRAVIKELRNDMFNKNYSGSTINKCLSALKSILEYAEEKSLIQYIPRIDRAAENPTQKGILTIEEVKELFSIDWPDKRGYVGSLLAASTGLRLGELKSLTLEDLHLEENYINVRRSWDKRNRTFTMTTKTGKARNIFIPENVKNEIVKLIELNPYNKTPKTFLFYADKISDKPAESEIFVRSLYKAFKKIGLDEQTRKDRNITFHSWRHFLNSLLINARIPLQKIQGLVGHSALGDMSHHYYRLDDMRDVINITGEILTGDKLN